MNQERVLKALIAPHVSEKSATVGDAHNQVVFKIARDATKREIKKAVESLFNVEVKGVNVVTIKGKQKRFGRREGRRTGVRKAYVTLMPGHDIDFTAGAE
jgi:large subunit ribosomal protein L23